MQTFEKITQELFSGSSPGGYFLLSLIALIATIGYKMKIETKLDELVKRKFPALDKDNPFSRVARENTQIWTDPEWRSLNSQKSFFEFLSIAPLLSGAWFGFNSVIVILGILFNW
jgi:hypothetical protein